MGHPLLDLKNKTAVVIGGTTGIGLAISKAFAQAGANVIPSSRRSEQVRAAVAEVEALGSRSLAQTCDVLDNDSLTQLLHSATAKFGSVQILVNSAGRTKKMPTLDFPDAEWGSIMETNLTGTLRSCRIFGPSHAGASLLAASSTSRRLLLLSRCRKSLPIAQAKQQLLRSPNRLLWNGRHRGSA